MLHIRAGVPLRAMVTWMIMSALVSVTLRYADRENELLAASACHYETVQEIDCMFRSVAKVSRITFCGP